MALGFSARHPEVGLFLSTNSDEEVFEWSELESGVFSHEVRSGLTGAADVDGDGAITYAELGGFVALANRGIERENLRPQIFFSGPRGNEQATLFSTHAIAGRKLTLGPDQERVWARNSTGERLVDLHKERGALTITLPNDGEELSVFVQKASPSKGQPPTLVEYRFAPGAEPIGLTEAPGEPPRLAARGDQLFGSLFATPYGPVAYDSYRKEASERPAPVYGVRDEDVMRMSNYLTALADVDRTQRRVAGITLTASGLVLGGTAAVSGLSEPGLKPGWVAGFAAGAAAMTGTGLYLSLTRSEGEQTLDAFRAELSARRGNRALAFARTEQKLQDVAQAERHGRQLSFWLLQAVAGTMLTVTTIGVMTDDEPQVGGYALLYGTAALTSAGGFLVLGIETPTERLLRLYRDDPGIKVRAGLSALPSGGLGLSLSGTF
jgi:hypothetical protein